MHDNPEIILASKSPRRAELLGRLGLTFSAWPPDIDETYLRGEDPSAHAQRLACEKAMAIAARKPDAIVIGSDTIVLLGGDVLGKPMNPGQAGEMLRRLAGREHQVLTGVAVAHESAVHAAVESVKVRFRELSAQECDEYVATGEPFDKAGSYGIQGYGSALVDSIEGDYFAVMGLPIVRMLSLLEKLGWRYAFGQGVVRAAPDDAGIGVKQ